MAARVMRNLNIDIAILTETRYTAEFYPNTSDGYSIFMARSISHHSGGIALLTRASRNWHLEDVMVWDENAISSILVSGKLKWILVGAYLPPSADFLPILDKVNEASSSSNFPLIFIGDFNTQFVRSSTRLTAVKETLVALGFFYRFGKTLQSKT